MSSHRGYYDKGDKRTQRDIEEDEMAESIHSNLVENLFDEEEALLNLHMNVIQGRLISHIMLSFLLQSRTFISYCLFHLSRFCFQEASF